MRAADAAKNTANLIEGTVKKIYEGSEIVRKTSAEFLQVAASAEKMSGLVGEDFGGFQRAGRGDRAD